MIGTEGRCGPGLAELLGAQERAAEIVSWPLLEQYAVALVRLSRSIPGSPVVWPIDSAAERLAGAAALLDGQSFRVRNWGQLLDDEVVLLTAVVALGPLALTEAAQHAKALGARAVFGCGAWVRYVDETPMGLDDFAILDRGARRRSA